MKRLFRADALLLFLVVLMAFATSAVVSLPSHEAAAASNCTYYSNASYTKVVGQFGYDCCNNPVSWGKKTQYVICGGCFICFPPPR